MARSIQWVVGAVFAPVLAAVAPAQGPAPATEAGPGVVGAGPGWPEGTIDCNVQCPPFPATVATGGDIRCLGVAAVQWSTPQGTAGKWFVSRSNGGFAFQTNQQVSIFDADLANNPIAATHRSIRRAPTFVAFNGSLWGHRDGEGYSWFDPALGQARAVVVFGDEGQQIHVLDAITESWVGSIPLTSPGPTTLRAIAVRPANPIVPDHNVLLYVSDWSNPIQEWAVDLNARTGSLLRTVPNPGLITGLTCFSRNGQWYLASHGQSPMTCPGTGLILLTVQSLQNSNLGAIVWQRSADPTVPGEAPNPDGGMAGGLQYAVVNGQPTLVALQQTVSDVLSFLPMGGYAILGPPDCGSEVLLPMGAPTSGEATGFLIQRAVSFRLYFGLMGFPPAVDFSLGLVGFDPNCHSGILPPVPVSIFLPPHVGNEVRLPLPIPAGFRTNVVLDAVMFDTGTLALSSTNRIELVICPPPF